MADPWDPPPDLSGGYVVLEYTNGLQTHRKRLHLLPFNPTTLNYLSPPGSETTVGDTVTAYFGQWEAFYTNAWTINVISLWNNAGGGVFTPCIPPTVAADVGTNSGLESLSPAGETIWVARTHGGHKFKLVDIAPADWAPVARVIATSGSVGAPGALISYLIGGNTGIRAHDGTQPTDYFSLSSPINERLWRHYHL